MKSDVVILLESKNHIVALVSEHIVEISDLHKLLSGNADRRHRQSNRHGLIFSGSEIPAAHPTLVRGRGHGYVHTCRIGRYVGNINIIKSEKPLVRRLMPPDSLHVIENVVLNMDAQPIDL